MSLHILGTHGIPNRHGGFERFAEELSVRLAEKGLDVSVYNPSNHPFREKTFQGVSIVRKWFPRFLGPAAPLAYDLLCLSHALRSGAEVILQCGYTSSVWLTLFPSRKGKKIITHMDGMEWQRAKWGRLTRRFIRWTEMMAVKYSVTVIADHREIMKYCQEKYGVEAEYVSYGVQIFREARVRSQESGSVDAGAGSGIEGLMDGEYFLIIARLEPENNLEMMVEGFLGYKWDGKLLIVGDKGTRYGKRLVKKNASSEKVIFTGAVYDRESTNRLRVHCRYYLHGHSAGGTNPSLLEAMAAGCAVLAHDNPFNRGVLGGFGKYFRDAEELSGLLSGPVDKTRQQEQVEWVRKEYDWEIVVERMAEIMKTTSPTTPTHPKTQYPNPHEPACPP